jgi:hypothetical protein
MICNAANVLRELFDHSQATLSDDKLEWLDNLSDCADFEAGNLAKTLEALALFFAHADKSSLPGNETVASILWGLSHQAETISAMVSIGQEAEYLAGKRKAERTKTDNNPA